MRAVQERLRCPQFILSRPRDLSGSSPKAVCLIQPLLDSGSWLLSLNSLNSFFHSASLGLMRHVALLVLVFCYFWSPGLHGADQKHLSIVDYFVLLPPDTFEGASPSSWLTFLKQPGSGSIDTANGY